jgi:hypothetical protein
VQHRRPSPFRACFARGDSFVPISVGHFFSARWSAKADFVHGHSLSLPQRLAENSRLILCAQDCAFERLGQCASKFLNVTIHATLLNGCLNDSGSGAGVWAQSTCTTTQQLAHCFCQRPFLKSIETAVKCLRALWREAFEQCTCKKVPTALDNERPNEINRYFNFDRETKLRQKRFA